MDERMRFVIRLKDGESMASLCREFGISRKTGYKIFERYEQCGLEGLSDRARGLSKSLAGQAVGIKEVEDGVWLVGFMDYDLGYIDSDKRTLQPLEIPSGQKCYPPPDLLGQE